MSTSKTSSAYSWHCRAALTIVPAFIAAQLWVASSVWTLRAAALTQDDAKNILTIVEADSAKQYAALLRSLDRIDRQLDSLVKTQREILLRLGAKE